MGVSGRGVVTPVWGETSPSKRVPKQQHEKSLVDETPRFCPRPREAHRTVRGFLLQSAFHETQAKLYTLPKIKIKERRERPSKILGNVEIHNTYYTIKRFIMTLSVENDGAWFSLVFP